MTGSNHETVSGDGHDILDEVDVIVRCDLCHTTYPVRASVIRDSQRVLAEGCTGGSLYECTASYMATLVDPDALGDLARAWQRFEWSATGHGGVGVVVHAGTLLDGRRPVDFDAAALARWENEGGAPWRR